MSDQNQSISARLHAFARSSVAFHVGYRSAACLIVGAVLALSVCAWTLAHPLAAALRAPGARFGTSLSVIALLSLGVVLRVRRVRWTSLSRAAGRSALATGFMAGITREAEVATGLVAALMGGWIIAGIPAAVQAVGGAIANALGMTTNGSVAITVLVVGAAGTLTSELARRGISEAIAST